MDGKNRAPSILKVKCPRCRKEVPYEGNPFRPFCSERCQLIDLGHWAEGKYSVPDDHSEAARNTPQSTEDEDTN